MATDNQTKKSNKSLIPEGYKGKTRKVKGLPHNRSSLHAGDVYEVSDDQAKSLIKAKMAEAVE